MSKMAARFGQFFRRKFYPHELRGSGGLNDKRSNVGSWGSRAWYDISTASLARIPEQARHYFKPGEKQKDMIEHRPCGGYDHKFLISKNGDRNNHAHVTLRYRKDGSFSHIEKHLPPKDERASQK